MNRYYSILKWRKQTPLFQSNFQMKKLDNYDNFLILDFESTCDKKYKLERQEIIEFPCIWADSNLNVISTFHRYIRPVENPVLTPFCTELTGIVQDMVEKENTFDKVLANFLNWLHIIESSVGNTSKTFVTCGDWDLKTMLPDQCQLCGIPVPPVMTQWINLKNVFMSITNYYPKSLKDMCQYLGLSFTGREHSGIDDCRNILEIMRALKTRTQT